MSKNYSTKNKNSNRGKMHSMAKSQKAWSRTHGVPKDAPLSRAERRAEERKSMKK